MPLPWAPTIYTWVQGGGWAPGVGWAGEGLLDLTLPAGYTAGPATVPEKPSGSITLMYPASPVMVMTMSLADLISSSFNRASTCRKKERAA